MSNGIKADDFDNRNVAAKLLQEKDKISPPAEIPSFWFSKRCLLVIMLFLGYCNTIMIRSNINIGVVKMTYKRNITETITITANITTTENITTAENIITTENITIQKNITIETQPEFDWSSQRVALVLSVNWYGYLFCVGGGYLATKFGGATMFGSSLMAMAWLNILVPLSLYIHFYAFLLNRLLFGVLDGFAYTGCAEVISRWAPIQERSTMMSMVFSGIYIGIAGTYPFCGYLAETWGWRVSFYVTGAICIIWSIMWLLVIKNQPAKDTWMSKKELQYIVENTEKTPRKEVVHPYREILMSPPVWALCVAKFAYSWGYTLLVTCFPIYVADITQKNTNEVGFIASIPNFACIFMIPLAGTIMDYWQNNSNLKAHQIHKIVMSIGFIVSSILFAVSALVYNFTVSMICFVLIKLLLSFNFLILQLICIYMAPRHSSIIAGVSALWFTLSTILLPTSVGFIVQNHSLDEWNTCFLLSGAVLMIGAVTYLLYGTSELQPWAKSSNDQTDIKNNKSFNK